MLQYTRTAVIHVLLACSVWILSAGAAHAYTDHYYGPFILREIKKGAVFVEPNDKPKTTTRSFTSNEMRAVGSAMNYWTERLGSTADPQIILNFAFAEEAGKADQSAYNWAVWNADANASVYNYIVNGKLDPVQSQYGYHSEIVFQRAYSALPTRLLMNDDSITSTVTHEMMHALGLGSPLRERIEGGGDWFIGTGSNAWTLGLRDIYDTQVSLDMTVKRAQGSTPDDGTFYLPAANGVGIMGPADTKQFPTFHGAAVDALTGGKGMPVMGGLGKDYKIDGGNTLGHPALLGSIMSYSPLRNMLFTELELAVLKDMGYNIDLKKSFGKSYYPTNLGGKLTQHGNNNHFGYLAETAATVENHQGFNSDYSYGVGLHVYRDLLNVTQRANITASGYGAGGIRVDGVENTITLPEGVTVAANGAYGTGVLVSYGRDNVLNIAGTVSATGVQGVGLHFGINGEESSQGNSYFYQDPGIVSIDNNWVNNTNSDDIYFITKMNFDLNGALAREVNISGSVTGSAAAILVEKDAHVKDINIQSSARVVGNIYVKWDRDKFAPANDKTDMSKYGTNLNFFGPEVASHGVGPVLRYDGVIDGRVDSAKTAKDNPNNSSLLLNFEGGSTSINGSVHAYSLTVDTGAVLKGNAAYDLYDKMLNKGTLAPGNSIGGITINGAFLNEGTLHMEFDGEGKTDTLKVLGLFTHAASGEVVVSPSEDYFDNGRIHLDPRAMFSSDDSSSVLPTDFEDAIDLASPTLRMEILEEGGEHYVLVSRDPHAYSQYARSGNAGRVGQALFGIADVATGDMEELIEALDFSAPDGSALHGAMKQLNSAAYAKAAEASSEANMALGRTALAQLRLAGGMGQKTDTTGLGAGDSSSAQWSAFMLPFGGGSQQQEYRDTPGYNASVVGLMGGALRQQDSLTLGLYTAYSRRQVDMWTTAGAQARSDALHVGAAALWSQQPGRGWQGWAQAQLGVENTDMQRSVSFEDYARKSTSFYTSFNGLAAVGGGYLWSVENFSFGPQVGLEYAFNSLPSVTEEDGQATRLEMDAYVRNDLYAVAGLTAQWRKDIGEGRSVRATLDAAWRQDLLPQWQQTRANFVGYGQWGFDTRTEREGGGGSLAMSGGVRVDLRQDISLNAQVQADVLRPGYTAVSGGLSLRWEF